MRPVVTQKRSTHGSAVAVKTTRITVETETLMIIRRPKVALAWCPERLMDQPRFASHRFCIASSWKTFGLVALPMRARRMPEGGCYETHHCTDNSCPFRHRVRSGHRA